MNGCRLFCVLGLFFSWGQIACADADLVGRVTDSATGYGIEGALVGLDALPADGSNEFEIVTDVFGMFDFDPFTADDYLLSASHPGYIPYGDTNTFAEASANTALISLAPALGVDGPGFEIYFQVVDVGSGVPLPGVPVSARRYVDEVAVAPTSTVRTVTDANGFGVILGQRRGHYLFHANDPADGTVRPKWRTFMTSNRVEVTKAHMASFMLKGDPLQDLVVFVDGHDPVLNGPGPLSNVVVELEGVSFTNPNEVVVPARSGVTDGSGKVTFKGLQPLVWRLKPKRLGYRLPPPPPCPPACPPIEETIALVFPDASGTLSPNPFPLGLDLESANLAVVLVSPYKDPEVLKFLPVHLEGLENTNTEGIERFAGAEPFGPESIAVFEDLLPGRYRVSVDITHPPFPDYSALECIPAKFFPHFSGATFVDVAGETNDVDLILDVSPATVRVRLFAADEQGELRQAFAGDPDDRPIYRLKQQKGIVFRDTEDNDILREAFKTNVVATTLAGEAVFSILPGIYGVEIPGMTNYVGHEILLTDVFEGVTIDSGWPYFTTWPHAGRATIHGCGVPFDSHHEYLLDLFVRKHGVNLRGEVNGDLFDPTTFQILANPSTLSEVDLFYSDVAEGGGVVRIVGDNGIDRSTNLTSAGENLAGHGTLAEYAFDNIPAGAYTVTVTHARQSFNDGNLTIIDWPAVGHPPFVEPLTEGDYLPQQTITLAGSPYNRGFGLEEINATFLGSGVVTMSVYSVDATGTYHLVNTVTDPQIVQALDYGSGRYFSPGGKMPTGNYRIWREFPPNGWFTDTGNGDAAFDVYLDGDLDNTFTTNEPPISYTLNVVARSADDPDLEITGVSVTLSSGETLTTPETRDTFKGSVTPTAATHGLWTWATSGETSDLDLVNTATPELTLTVWMMRGMGVSGTVVEAGSPGPEFDEPVASSQITVRDRFGHSLRVTATDSNGNFAVSSALDAMQAVFVEVRKAGFKPWRQRFSPDPMAGSTDIVVNAEIEMIPSPVISAATVDRHGVFLPGISKAGDQSVFTELSADAALSMTWTATVHNAVYTNTIAQFDNPDGSTNDVAMLVVTDAVHEVWFVDQRRFPDGVYQGDGLLHAAPGGDDGYVLVRTWLAHIDSGRVTNVYRRVARRLVSGTTNAITYASGHEKLWLLPPGKLNPAIIAFSDGGAVGVMDVFPWRSPVNQYRLRGLRVPPWMGTISDIMAVVGKVGGTADDLGVTLPEGRFSPLPKFKSSIAEIKDNNEGTGFVSYDWEVGVEWNEGMRTPVSSLLALAPANLGLVFEGAMKVGLDGQSGDGSMSVSADVLTDDLDVADYVPKLASDDIKLKAKLKVGAESTLTENFNQTTNLQFEIAHEVGGGVNMIVQANLRPVLGKIPYAGPVLIALDKTKGLQFFGLMQGGMGQEMTVKWRTYYPPSVEGVSSADLNPHVLRRHFAGGKSEVLVQAKLCFQFGLGLAIEALGGRVGATGKIALQGNNCGRQPVPSASVTFNSDADWPMITRVEGNATASLEAFLKAWTLKYSKSWTWELLKFDVNFGTEPVFDLIAMSVDQALLTPGTELPDSFDGEGPVLVNNHYASGTHSTAGGGMLVYSGIDPGTTSMAVRVSLPDGVGGNVSPTNLVSAGGIIAVAALALPSGEWMTLWSSIDAVDRFNPFPSSDIYFTTSSVAGSVWSPPALVSGRPGVASALYPVTSHDTTALFFMETSEGPSASRYDLFLTELAGSSWVTPLNVSPLTEFRAFDVAGSDSSVVTSVAIAFVDGTDDARIATWDGLAFSPILELASNALHSVCVGADTNGGYWAAWGQQHGGIGASVLDEGGTLHPMGTVFTNAFPHELCLTPLAAPSGTCFLVTWTEGGDVREILYGVVDSSGQEMVAPTRLTKNKLGYYSSLRVIPGSNWNARVIARYERNPVEIRTFDIKIGAGGGNNDADNDQFNDTLELIIVDHDLTDAVSNITDVVPEGDFDGDGISNFAEFYLGLDPTDESSVLAILEFAKTNDVDLGFITSDTILYGVESHTNLLGEAAWTNLLDITGDGFYRQIDVPASPAPREFFRVRTEVPAPSP